MMDRHEAAMKSMNERHMNEMQTPGGSPDGDMDNMPVDGAAGAPTGGGGAAV